MRVEGCVCGCGGKEYNVRQREGAGDRAKLSGNTAVGISTTCVLLCVDEEERTENACVYETVQGAREGSCEREAGGRGDGNTSNGGGSSR